jgi:hypothetical protein
MKFPFEKGWQGTFGALQVAQKVLGGLSHLKKKLTNSGNALPKILSTFYSFLQFFTESNRREISRNGIN